ncbi:MAG TPA: T9SS type A sorting domain-containing protein [Candidatus Marinimicrobia bacterium]|nr:T9SS type A sorting domain-containing protein [Candidatus Neomarinimicrobiota bacterium]
MEWQVSQNYYESGLPYFDINGDGFPELTKYLGNSLTFYDGLQNWSIIWSLNAPNYDELLLWDLYEINGNKTALCLATLIINQVSTTVQAYSVFNNTPLWTSPEMEGYYSNVVITDLNRQDGDEILIGVNIWNESGANYTSRFYILNGETGNMDYQSILFSGYMYGPNVGDCDGDGVKEIFINIYEADNTSILYVFGYESPNKTVYNENTVSMMDAVYPNPANNQFSIPFTIKEPMNVIITLFDTNGRELDCIMNQSLNPGDYNPTVRLPQSESGVYFIRLQLGNTIQNRKLILLK